MDFVLVAMTPNASCGIALLVCYARGSKAGTLTWKACSLQQEEEESGGHLSKRNIRQSGGGRGRRKVRRLALLFWIPGKGWDGMDRKRIEKTRKKKR